MLIAAELLKAWTTRVRWAFPLIAVALAALPTAGTIGASSPFERADSSFVDDWASSAGTAGIVAYVLGIVLATAEFRHGTITPTFLATPTRWPVLVAKSVATAAVGALLGVAAVAGVLAVAVPWLGAIGESLSLGDAAPTLAKSVLIAALLAALGVAIGSLVHSQAGALAGGLIALLVAEPLVVALAGVVDLDGIDRYLPASAIFGVADPSADDPLPLAAGVLVGLGWITAVGVLGIFRTMGRDFT